METKKATNWKTKSQKYVYESKWLKLRHDNVIRPDGKDGEYDVLEKKDFVIVIPKLGHKYLLIEQDRYPVSDRSLEFPQGNVEQNESNEDAAKREFEEETGNVAGKIKYLGYLWLACGYSTQGYYVYLASGLKKGKQHLEGSEADLKVRILSEEKLSLEIKNGTVKDSSTVAAFGLYMINN